jgi:hypothetical protein
MPPVTDPAVGAGIFALAAGEAKVVLTTSMVAGNRVGVLSLAPKELDEGVQERED